MDVASNGPDLARWIFLQESGKICIFLARQAFLQARKLQEKIF